MNLRIPATVTLSTLSIVVASFVIDPPIARAQALQPVSVIAFPGVGNWLIRIAQDKGYFTREGVVITLTPTSNSVFQMTNLIDGKFDIAMTSIG